MTQNFDIERTVAVQREEGETPFLGRLLWFTISDMRVKYDDLKQAFIAAGVSEDYLPKPISERDAFRRATKEAEQKRIPMEDDKHLNLLVREVAMNDKVIIRDLVREIVDGKNVRLDYKPIARMILQDGQIKFEGDPNDPLNEAENKTLDRIEKEYEIGKEHYNGRHVRDLVTKVLKDCNPVIVRPSGGVYFAPIAFEESILALQRLIKDLSQYAVTTAEKARLWSVPVIDTADQREMLHESLEDQVESDSKALIGEMSRMLQSGKKITEAAAKQYVERTKQMRESVKGYESMLEERMFKCESDIEIALQQAMKLMERVEV